jgi:hypothetical protein
MFGLPRMLFEEEKDEDWDSNIGVHSVCPVLSQKGKWGSNLT